MAQIRKPATFQGRDTDVTWDGRLCIHAEECVRAKESLFVAGRKAWFDQGDAAAETVAEVVSRCPTGSLSAVRQDAEPLEKADATNTVTVGMNGPLFVRGRLEIDGAPDDMPGVRFRAALCRCGHSKNKPFCDNSHKEAGFADSGAVGSTGTVIEATGGPLEIRRSKNGPLLLAGNFSIRTGSGREAWQGTKAALCRCGHSKNKPFCDGSHREAGFEAE